MSSNEHAPPRLIRAATTVVAGVLGLAALAAPPLTASAASSATSAAWARPTTSSLTASTSTSGPAGTSYAVFHLSDTLGGPVDRSYTYGLPTDRPIAGDWNADLVTQLIRRDTLAVRRGNTMLLNHRHDESPDQTSTFGKAEDVILRGDWDGDGGDTFAVRRGNAYHFRNSLSSGPADAVIRYGRADDEVFVGDFDGDGVDTLAVRRGSTFYVRNSISSGVADRVFPYGRVGDEVLVGRWSRSLGQSFAIRRGNVFYVKDSLEGGPADLTFSFGRATDEVLVGDWNGDWRDTFGLRRIQSTAPPSPVGSGPIERLSVAWDGTDGWLESDEPALSGDGRHVAFYTRARNMLPQGLPARSVLVRDRTSGTMRCLGDANGCYDLEHGGRITISHDGGVVATSKWGSLYVSDARRGAMAFRIEGSDLYPEAEVANLGAPNVSGDGRFLAFVASTFTSGGRAVASELVLYDLVTGEREVLAHRAAVEPAPWPWVPAATYLPSLSHDGRFVSYVSNSPSEVDGDTNGSWDTFLLDRSTDSTRRISVTQAGGQSSDANWGTSSISADGLFVVFTSSSALVPEDTNGVEDAYLYDSSADAVTRVSVTAGGAQSQDPTRSVAISADGRFVAFTNSSHLFFPEDPHGKRHAYVRDTLTQQVVRASSAFDSTPGNRNSDAVTISADGRWVAFASSSTNLVPDDGNGWIVDVFVKDLALWTSRSQ